VVVMVVFCQFVYFTVSFLTPMLKNGGGGGGGVGVGGGCGGGVLSFLSIILCHFLYKC